MKENRDSPTTNSDLHRFFAKQLSINTNAGSPKKGPPALSGTMRFRGKLGLADLGDEAIEGVFVAPRSKGLIRVSTPAAEAATTPRTARRTEIRPRSRAR